MNDIDVLRKAIRRYVLSPWHVKMNDYEEAKVNAAYNGEMYGPVHPDASELMSVLSGLISANVDSLRYQLEMDESKDRIAMKEKRKRLAAELAMVESQLSGYEDGE